MPQIEFGDKLSHLIAYATLTGWFSQLYFRLPTQIKICMAFCVMGIVLEILQGMGGVRMFEYADMAANATGALLGLILSRTWFQGALVKVDRFLAVKFNS